MTSPYLAPLLPKDQASFLLALMSPERSVAQQLQEPQLNLRTLLVSISSGLLRSPVPQSLAVLVSSPPFPVLMVRLQLKFLAQQLQVYPVSLLQSLPLLVLVPNSLLVTI